jgi:hypothetical protein
LHFPKNLRLHYPYYCQLRSFKSISLAPAITIVSPTWELDTIDLKLRASTSKMPDDKDQSLGTLLTIEQRGELTVLIANTIESMRNDILKTFEVQDKPPKSTEALLKVPADELDLDGQPQSPIKLAPSDEANTKRLRERREADLSAPKVQELKTACLAYFDGWRDSVILRVGEVLNSQSHAKKSKDDRHAQRVAQKGDEESDTADKTLESIYPPEPTSLANLAHGERSTILNAMLLLILSLESYQAHSRTLLLRLASTLHISTNELTKMEEDIAQGLITAAEHMSGEASTAAASKANESSRKWKVGLASVAGAALIGVTGGLAAPLVAAGVGGLMGGIGLGATTAAGYLGALAGSGVFVGGLFGAYGGRMTGRMMDAYAREVQDFGFVPVRGTVDKHRFWHGGGEKGREYVAEKTKRRLRVTIGVTGWLTEETGVMSPWRVLGEGGEAFALRWELQALLALGNALQNFVTTYAWGYIKKEIIKRTVLAGWWSALMLPLAMLKISKLVDNPFSVAKARADKAGEVLADALISKAQGERPVSLVGYSLGGRVIYSCLLALAERKAFGLIDSVVVMGAPMPSDATDLRTLRSVVSGRFVNVYSENDYILAFLYRTSSVQLGIAGLQAVEGVHGVESVNVADLVSGHLRYQYAVGMILSKIGWADIDEEERYREELIARQLAEAEERKREVDGEDGEPDEKKLEEEARRLREVQGGLEDEKDNVQDGHGKVLQHS